MAIHAECTVYAFLTLLMAISLPRRPPRDPVKPGNDGTDGSRTGEADSSSVICWLVRGHVCAGIAGVDSVRTITADSFEFLPRVCYSQCTVGTSPWPWVRIAATHSGQGTPIEPTVPQARPPRAPLPASTKWIPASKCLVTVRFGLVSD